MNIHITSFFIYNKNIRAKTGKISVENIQNTSGADKLTDINYLLIL